MEDAEKNNLPENKKNSKNYWILFCIVLFGLGLRLINLQAQPFWADEVLSLDISTTFHHISQIVQYLATVEIHPPLYYILLHFWTNWFGAGTLSARFPSLIFGLGCIVGTYLWGKIVLKSEKIGLLAAFLTAILPFQLEFNQEARPYIIFCFFGIVACISLWQYYRTKRKSYMVIYVIASLFGIYLHYSYLMILVPLALWGLIEIFQNRETWSRELTIWVVANGAILLGFSYWLEPFLYKVFALNNVTIFSYPRFPSYVRVPDFFEWIHGQILWFTGETNLSQVETMVAFLAKLCLLAAFVWACYALFQKGKNKESWWPLLFTAWMVEIPIVFFFFSGESVPYTLYYERHVILVTIPVVVLIAWAISMLPKKQAVAAFAILVISLIPYTTDILLNGAWSDSNYNMQSDGQFINQNYEPGDMVIVSLAPGRTDLTHYLNDNIPVYSLFPVNYYFNQDDIDATRHTLGFIENEYQFRVATIDPAQAQFKLTELDKLYHPKRIWLYAFRPDDFPVYYWFSDRNWRHVYSSISSFDELELYSVK